MFIKGSTYLILPKDVLIVSSDCLNIFDHMECVVYFDQQMHAYACVHMVENNKKMLENYQKLLFSSCAQETHVRLT